MLSSRYTRLLWCVAAVFVILLSGSRAVAQPTAVDYDAMMVEYGLVDICEMDSTILVELKYSTDDNFVGRDMYGSLERAYLVENFARKVLRAQQILRARHPEYTLLIYDAARPISVQRTMRRMVEGTPLQSFVADGTRGGRHNYGVGVDLTIATLDGEPLDMGAAFDEFSEASAVKATPDTSDANSRTITVFRDYVQALVRRGVIGEAQGANRILLLEVMCEAGLVPYRREWWHYEELMPMSTVRERYRLLDF